MTAPANTKRFSLERLKALDEIPTLQLQLKEANSLCNHPARADMILKWLLGKLKSSEEARKATECWNLISSCLRLLPAHKAAFLLGSAAYVDILATTAASELSNSGTVAAARCLDLLYELGQSAGGAVIRSLLSIPSATAATICGNWMSHAVKLYEQSTASYGYIEQTFGPILRLWYLRKPGAADDDLFNQSCLLPALLLISILRDSDIGLSVKRRLSSNDLKSAHGCKNCLESLIAKHMVLPARNVFFKAREQHPRRSRKAESDAMPSGLRERLGALKLAIWNDTEKRSLKTVPLLLDVALRSKALPTPRDRTNEKPWLEEIWSALRGCFANRNRQAQNETLSAMLRVLQQNGLVLSKEVLTDVVRNDALPGEGNGDLIDVRVITGVVALESSVFSDETLARSIFDHITAKSSIHGSRTVTKSIGKDERLSTVVQHEILVPIMRSHARSRNLDGFLKLWNEQLQKEHNLDPRSIWHDLKGPFAELVEDALTQKQSLILIHERASLIHEETSLSIPLLNSTLVTLEALLRGVRDDSMKARLQNELDLLIRDLFVLTELDTASVHETLPCQLWQLLSRTLKMWFPSWAANQTDLQAVAESGASLLSRKTVQVALDQASAQEKSGSNILAAYAAQNFCAELYFCFHKLDHKQCQNLCADLLERLQPTLHTLLRAPDCLIKLKSDQRRRIISSSLHAASKVGNLNSTHAAIDLQAVGHMGQSSGPRIILDDLVSAVRDHFVVERKDDSADDGEAILLSLILKLNVGSLTRAQRALLLDTISSLHTFSHLERRLSATLALASPPCLDAKLFDDASYLWNILADFKTSDTQAIRLLEEVTSQVLRAWIATHQRQRSQQLLTQFSSMLARYIADTFVGMSINEISFHAATAFIKITISLLETVPAESTQGQMPHRAKKTAKQYVDQLLSSANSALQAMETDAMSDPDNNVSRAVPSVLDAIIAVPNSIWQQSGRGADDTIEIAQRAAAVLTSTLGASRDCVLDAADIVSCFHAVCRFEGSNNEDLTILARGVLELKLMAPLYRAVISSYEDVLEAAEQHGKLRALTPLLKTSTPQSAHSLILLRVITGALDTENDDDGKTILATILNAHISAVDEDNRSDVLRAALDSIADFAKRKPGAVNQYAVERTLSALQRVLKRNHSTGGIYASICHVMVVLFANHRARLQGRAHLLLGVLQALLSYLFDNKQSSAEALTHHAHLLSKLFELFCNPPQYRHSRKSKSSQLIDEARKAQAHAGQFAQYILHHYCGLILSGAPADGVREALSPGLYTVIEAMEVNSADGVKVLSAAMNNSERAVLRSLYDDWKRFGKWEGT